MEGTARFQTGGLTLLPGSRWIGLTRNSWGIAFNDYMGWEDKSLDDPITRDEYMQRLKVCGISANPWKFGNWELINLYK
jgi:hypothetical protein